MKKNTCLSFCLITTIILLFLTTVNSAQVIKDLSKNADEIKIKPNSFYLSLEGGFTQGFTDYKNQAISSVFRLGTEFNFHPVAGLNLGFGLRGGLGKIDNKDSRDRITTNDGLRNIPPKISTGFFEIGVTGSVGIDIFEIISPYLLLSASYFNFNPQLDNGSDAPFNQAGVYENTIANIGFGGGMRYTITHAVSLYVQSEFFTPSTDYLEDVSASSSKDSYVTFTFGISYNFLGKKDTESELRKLLMPEENLQKPEDIQGVRKEDKKTVTEPVEPPVEKKQQAEVPEEKVEEPVNDLGIMVEEMVLSADELFEGNTAKFKEDAFKQLDDVVKFLKKVPDTRWRIEGHMDSQANTLFIKRISYERAKAVLDYLVSKGLPQERFEVYGLADNFPIANNLTEEGRKQNRRIRIVLQ